MGKPKKKDLNTTLYYYYLFRLWAIPLVMHRPDAAVQILNQYIPPHVLFFRNVPVPSLLSHCLGAWLSKLSCRLVYTVYYKPRIQGGIGYRGAISKLANGGPPYIPICRGRV